MNDNEIGLTMESVFRLVMADSQLREMLYYRLTAMKAVEAIGRSVADGTMTVDEAASRTREFAQNQPYRIVSNKPVMRGE